MLFHLLAAVVSVVVALIRGGSFRAIPQVERLWVPPIAALLQLSTALYPASYAATAVMIGSYCLLIWFVRGNWHFKGLRLLAVGLGMNLLVIGINGGRMPTSVAATHIAGVSAEDIALLESGATPKHSPLSPDSRVAFLGDIIPVKYPLPRVISLGDVFILLGAFLLVQEGMGKRVLLFGPGEST